MLKFLVIWSGIMTFMSLGRHSTLEVDVSFARQVSLISYHLATLSWLLAELLAASCWLRFI